MSNASRRLAGILLVVYPTVIVGGISLLRFLAEAETGYVDNPVRQDLWRAGHAHAGILLMLSLVVLRYVDDATLSERARGYVRNAVPAAAILLPVAFFLSILSPSTRAPSDLVYLAYLGAAILAAGLVTLGVGLLRAARSPSP